MKKYLYFATAALALASCASDDFVGTGESTGESGAIRFASATSGQTRADHVGADAASLLNKNFVVSGTKGGVIGDKSSVVQTVVFDNYNVNWTENTAATTESNTSDWEYVGQTVNAHATTNGITAQSIKYWDYSAGQYDFIAYSLGNASPAATVTAITPSTATSAAHGGAYKLTGTVDKLKTCYIADLVTIPQANYGNEVSIKFRNLAAKIRVALYETVPGYSIKDVEFFESDAATAGTQTTNAQLYSSVASIVKEATYTVYYPTVNSTATTVPGYQATDINKAHVAVAATSASSKLELGAALDYANAKTLEDGSTPGTKVEKKYLGETSATATYVGSTTDKTYYTVLPNEDGTGLTLRCNYTLVSNDGSKEVIKVWGAKAVIPTIYCQWKPNYAYTYIFKISDNTNGQTQALGLGTAGLTPITFDAVTEDSEDGTQSTITTVATPSITTYQKGHDVTKDEYSAATGDIYVMVQEDATLKNDLDTKGQLYVVTGASANVPATEANVMDALCLRADASGNPINGRNGLVLTEATSDATITAIPGANGNDITVTAKTAAKFTPTASNTYAYVYKVADGADENVYTAVTVAAGATIPADTYYTMNADGTYTVVAAGTNGATDVILYKKYVKTNRTYAVKVIKVVA